MKTKFRIHLLLLIVAGALLAGCSKDSTTPENGKDDNNPTVQVSKDNSLTNFSFKKDKNTSLESNCSSQQEGNVHPAGGVEKSQIGQKQHPFLDFASQCVIQQQNHQGKNQKRYGLIAHLVCLSLQLC